MTFRHSAFLALLVTGGALSLVSCGVAVREAAGGYKALRYSQVFATGQRGPLSPAETEWAKIAWRYFENNTAGETGLAGGLDKTPIATAWNIGDYLAALNAARALGILKERDFSDRAVRVVRFLNSMDLFDQKLPNLYYNVQTGAMSNAASAPKEEGWSAIDLGRLLIWLRITSQTAPALAEYIDKAVLRWNFCDIVDGEGSLYGGRRVADKTEIVQEGRLGYEEYAAFGFQLWGFDTRRASRLEPFEKVLIEGVEVRYDSRDPRRGNVYAPVGTVPYALLGIEFNWDSVNSRDEVAGDTTLASLARSVYQVQEARFRKEHILTARTDHPLAHPPGFVYDSIFVAGYPWNTIGMDGVFAPQEALVSTRAVFGMWALWKTPYTKTLMKSAQILNDPAKGWFEGQLERTGGPEPTVSSTTNAVILEALLYMKSGRLLRARSVDDYYTLALRSEFGGPQTCLPQRR